MCLGKANLELEYFTENLAQRKRFTVRKFLTMDSEIDIQINWSKDRKKGCLLCEWLVGVKKKCVLCACFKGCRGWTWVVGHIQATTTTHRIHSRPSIHPTPKTPRTPCWKMGNRRKRVGCHIVRADHTPACGRQAARGTAESPTGCSSPRPAGARRPGRARPQALQAGNFASPPLN